MEKNWSYYTGVRGESRVRVYERYPGGPLQVDATGLPRQALQKAFGVPVVDKTIAVVFAHRLSDRLSNGATGKSAADVLGLKPEPAAPLSQAALGEIVREAKEEHSKADV